MANDASPRRPARKPGRRWDYSNHALKDGGTQVVALVVGIGVTFLLAALFVAWLVLTQGPPGPASP